MRATDRRNIGLLIAALAIIGLLAYFAGGSARMPSLPAETRVNLTDRNVAAEGVDFSLASSPQSPTADPAYNLTEKAGIGAHRIIVISVPDIQGTLARLDFCARTIENSRAKLRVEYGEPQSQASSEEWYGRADIDLTDRAEVTGRIESVQVTLLRDNWYLISVSLLIRQGKGNLAIGLMNGERASYAGEPGKGVSLCVPHWTGH